MKKKKAKKQQQQQRGMGASDGDLIWVDPARVRFQHSRIRPVFSGCGRSVEGTLEEIRQQKLHPRDLPPIQVIVGPTDDTDGLPWYFSLNNRRLWVLKRCREEGLLLPNNQVQVRVRPFKSAAEQTRYTLENCAVEAKFIKEPSQQQHTKSMPASDGSKQDKNEEEELVKQQKDLQLEDRCDKQPFKAKDVQSQSMAMMPANKDDSCGGEAELGVQLKKDEDGDDDSSSTSSSFSETYAGSKNPFSVLG